MLVKDWHWRLHLSIVLVNLLKSPVLGTKYPFGVFLRKRGSLDDWDIQDL